MKNVRFMVQAAIIAAVYVVLMLLFTFSSSGLLQVRVAEALSVLTAFTPAAIPGLFVGCLLGNIITGAAPMDIIFGSLTTLAAAYMSYRLRSRKWLVPLPAVIFNAIVVGAFILPYVYGVPVSPIAAILWVGLGQLIACYVIGYPLLTALSKYKDKIFGL